MFGEAGALYSHTADSLHDSQVSEQFVRCDVALAANHKLNSASTKVWPSLQGALTVRQQQLIYRLPSSSASVCSFSFSEAVANKVPSISAWCPLAWSANRASVSSTYMMLSVNSVNHRVEVERPKDSREKTRERFLRNIRC